MEEAARWHPYRVARWPVPCRVGLLECGTVRHAVNDCLAVCYGIVLALLAKQFGRYVDSFGLREIEHRRIAQQERSLLFGTAVRFPYFALFANVPIND